MILFWINLFFLIAMAYVLFHKNMPELDGRKRERIYLAVTMGYLALLAMLRGGTIGKDTDDYIALFYRIAQQPGLREAFDCTSKEAGYVLLNFLIAQVTDNAQWLIVLTSAFVFGCFAWFFRKHSSMPRLSVYLFFTLMLFDFCLSGIRQSVAIAILLLSYDALLERKPLRFCLLCCAAAAFHTTAILWLAVYPLMRLFRSNKTFFFVLVGVGAAVFLLWDLTLTVLLWIFPKYAYYTEEAGFDSGGVLAVSCKLAVYLAVLGFGTLVGRKNPELEISGRERSAQRIIWILLPLCLVSIKASVFSRFFVYFEPFICIYLPNVVCKITSKKERNFFVAAIVIAFAVYAAAIQLLRTPAWQNTYPYSFFWK